MAVSLRLRPGTPDDLAACASICHAAFGAIAGRHNFPTDFPTVEPAEQLIASLLARADVYSVVAETTTAAWSAATSSGRRRRSPASARSPSTRPRRTARSAGG